MPPSRLQIHSEAVHHDNNGVPLARPDAIRHIGQCRKAVTRPTGISGVSAIVPTGVARSRHSRAETDGLMQRGKPPLHSGFQKGHSGNPGRPSQRHHPGQNYEPGPQTSGSSRHSTGGRQGVPDNDIRGRDPQVASARIVP